MMRSVHCPSCDTHYGLRRARVRPGIRRARCYRCGTLFGIEAEVMGLLTSLSGPDVPAPPLASDFLEPALAEPPPPLPPVAEADLDLPSLEELEAATEALEPLEVLEPAEALEPDAPVMEGILSPDDLTGAEAEILDKTLVDFQPEEHPEVRPTPPQVPPVQDEEEFLAASGSYSSAKDAIAKLLGEAPPPPAYRPHSARGGAAMDVEATLSALENTLGGVPGTQTHPPLGSVLQPSDLPPPAGATVQLSRAEVAAAMQQAAPPAPRPSPPPEPTVALNLDRSAAESTVVLRMAPGGPPPPAMDPNLLKVQMGTELYSNLTMEQLVGLAEQGRLAEYHMVARQFSDNWLEASKVPGLRPTFERLRKARLAEPPPASPLETAPIKKSLFGGLFGKGN
ncbi:MAG: zinc-ribbon domain-containing protein [Acidobacteria bacterium]|nr:zinc-ribbon domain-containing protein [Acidobacteriota bacterium]